MTDPSTVRAAYAACRRIAARHYENFPVASFLVPRAQRDALASIYAFARLADDLADEPGVEDRLQNLEAWRRKLELAYAGEAQHPVFVALADAARKFRLSRENFEKLLRAFELDVRVKIHSDASSVLAYCACSANPVGRLVLELFGDRDPGLLALSDSICTALQLTNFWQDVAVDLEQGRVYIPLEDFGRFRYSLDDLLAHRVDGRWRALMAYEVSWARELFAKGEDLPARVSPSLRRQLRLTWLGGLEVLEKIEGAEYDVFHRRPSLGLFDFLRLYWRARRAFRADASAARVGGTASRAANRPAGSSTA